MAGVTRLDEGRGGVDGVPPAPQHVGRVQELGVGDGLQTVRRQLVRIAKFGVKFSIRGVFVNTYACLRRLPTQLPYASSPFRRLPAPLLPARSPSPWH